MALLKSLEKGGAQQPIGLSLEGPPPPLPAPPPPVSSLEVLEQKLEAARAAHREAEKLAVEKASAREKLEREVRSLRASRSAFDLEDLGSAAAVVSPLVTPAGGGRSAASPSSSPRSLGSFSPRASGREKKLNDTSNTGAGLQTEEEELRGYFDRTCKRYCSEALSKNAFASLVKQLCKANAAREVPTKQDLEAAFLLADEDGNGSVDFDEVSAPRDPHVPLSSPNSVSL